MKAIKFIAMFAAAVAVGASFAGVDSYLYYMVDASNLKYNEVAGSTLADTAVPVDEDTYAMVSTDGGQTYLTLYGAGGSTGTSELELGKTGIVGFSKTPSFTTFLFEVYDGYDNKLGWTTLAYKDASQFIYGDSVNPGNTGVFHITSLIPEPTSGLLFLLGAAGLALRRRRKVCA